MESRGEIHGYLSDGEFARANVARWWRTTPPDLKRISRREFRIMAEYMARAIKAQEEAIEAAKHGLPTPGRSTRGRPKAGDEIVAPTRSNPTGDNRW